MTADRQENHLRVMIERLQREGWAEGDIVRAVEAASDESRRADERPLRKQA